MQKTRYKTFLIIIPDILESQSDMANNIGNGIASILSDIFGISNRENYDEYVTISFHTREILKN